MKTKRKLEITVENTFTAIDKEIGLPIAISFEKFYSYEGNPSLKKTIQCRLLIICFLITFRFKAK